MIKVVAKSFSKPDKLDEILKLTAEMVEKTVNEEGCIKYEAFQDIRAPEVIIIIEEWESQEALNRHMASEHFRRIVPKLNELRQKASEVNVLKKLF
jgi:quinol monooxygenase YgiN